MQRFKNILLVFDKNVEVLRRTVALVKNSRARLTVVDVIEQVPRDKGMLVTGMPAQELQRLVVKDRQERLEALIAPVRKQRVRVRGEILIGRPFEMIIREVIRRKHDLVIMAAERHVALRHRLFGSTSMHLMRKCPCPVWVMKRTRRKRYARIAAAVDPDSSQKERALLNVKIMELATSLARMTKGELHIIHAWTLFGESVLRNRLSKRELDEWVREERKNRKALVNELLQPYSLRNLHHELHLIKGKAGMVIPAVTERVAADVLVMGTVCRTGVAGLFIGNTAEEVLQQVRCSVLTVKPDSFVTPISG